MRRAAEPAGVAVVLTLGLVAALATGAPGKLALQAWLLALGALGLLTANLALRSPRQPSALERALRRRDPAPERPMQVERIEREVAAQRLAERRGLELDEAGPDVLTAETWALLRPDREPPRDRHGPGMPVARLAVILDELESI